MLPSCSADRARVGYRGVRQQLTQLDEFEGFVTSAEPSLRRALSGHMRPDQVDDAIAAAFLYAYEHWDREATMASPVGYLFRVAQSATRVRRWAVLPMRPVDDVPDPIDERLVSALRSLPRQQRSAVWLVHACGWTQREAAAALGLSRSTLGTHVARGMARLRTTMGEPE